MGTAVAILAVFAASILILGTSPGDVADPTIQPTVATVPSSTTVSSTTTIPSAEAWNPILGTTLAKAAPSAATRPAGTDPNTPGPVDQERPQPGPWNNQAAVFDQHTGRIVYADQTDETWTFDVCTNIWQQMDPEGAPYIVGELVYDVDSDRVVAVGPDILAVYDANSNIWTRRPPSIAIGLGFGSPGLGAVYDPVSGLVIVLTDGGELVAYDVDSDEWIPVGPIDRDSAYPPLPNRLYGREGPTELPAILRCAKPGRSRSGRPTQRRNHAPGGSSRRRGRGIRQTQIRNWG